MTQTAFLQQIEVGSSSFQRFMNYKGTNIEIWIQGCICKIIKGSISIVCMLFKQNDVAGESGVDNGTFWGALRFFNERGMLKLKKRKAPVDVAE